MSSRACSALMAAASAWMSADLPASTLCALPPIPAAVAVTPGSSMSAQMTVAPSAKNASADALPMPEAAPSTSAFLPLRSNMRRHRGGGAGRIARLDRLDDGDVLLEHPRHASRHRQGEAAIAIHLNFHLLDQGPDARMPCGFRDRRMKGFVGLMEAVTISGPLHPALTLDQPVEFRYLFRTRGLGRESRRQLLERLADQDRFRQRGERNPGHKSPRLGKDVDQRLVGEPQNGFAHRRAADAVVRRDLPLDDGFAGLALHRDDFRLE